MRDTALIVLALMMALVNPVKSAEAEMKKDTVILLHGIGHSRLNMLVTEMALRKAGYDTLNISYPSRSNDIEALAGFVQERLRMECVWEKGGQVHFVTHSMGGLVTRRYLNDYKSEIPADKLGRVVMMAPPNGGSEVADLLKDFPPYHWMFGPAGRELTTAAQAENTITPYYELGIIAGTTGWPYVMGAFIPGRHDGRVALEKTKLGGMKDHVAIPATHSFIAWKPSVHKQIVNFIEGGEFHHGKE